MSMLSTTINDFTTTCHFKDKESACLYYKPYGLSEIDVDVKIQLGEICIGKPKIKPNDYLHVSRAGQYVIETNNFFKHQNLNQSN